MFKRLLFSVSLLFLLGFTLPSHVEGPKGDIGVSAPVHAQIKAGAPHWHFHADICAPGPIPQQYNGTCGAGTHLVAQREASNMVTRDGCEALLTQTFKDTSGVAAWYVGEIKAYTSFSTSDTMASHTNWTSEASGSTDITNANRPTLTIGAINKTADAVYGDNSGSVAVFNQNSTITLKGFYVTDSNTVGGATGTLYGEATFTDAPVAAGYTVNVTVTLTATAG